MGIGPASHWTVHAAELIGIYKAVETMDRETTDRTHEENDHAKRFTVVSDSQSAIQTISNPASRPGQGIVRRILDQAQMPRERGIRIRLCWIPGHSGNDGNEMAKQAVSLEVQHDFHHLLSFKRTATGRSGRMAARVECDTEGQTSETNR
jgi:ribonuclease HI